MRLKHLKRKAAAVCAAILLAGCGTPQPGDAVSGEPPGSFDAVQAREEPDEKAAPQLRLISPVGGVIFAGPAILDSGFYEVVYGKDVISGTGNLVYTDYASRKRMYLSEEINTDHQDASDRSYLPSLIGGCCVLTDGNYLYFVKGGAQSLAAEYGRDGVSTLYRMELDGSDRRELYFASNQNLEVSGGIVSDGESLYLAVRTVERDTQARLELMKADFESETLCSVFSVTGQFGRGNHSALVGAAGQELVLQNAVWSEESKESTITFYSMNPSNGEFRELLSISGKDYRTIYREGGLYLLKPDPMTLYQVKLETGERILLQPQPAPPDGEYTAIQIGTRSIEPYFSFRFVNEATQEEWYYEWDQQTNTWHEETLTDGDWQVQIVATVGDLFLVQLHDKTVSYQDYTDSGETWTNSMAVSRYALITQENYWNGIPEYRLFQDEVYGE